MVYNGPTKERMLMKRLTILVLALSLLLCGCSMEDPAATGTAATGPAETVDFAQTDAELFTERDLAGTWENPVTITLQGDTAVCSGSGVSVSGSTVTIAAEGTYLLTGKLTGSILIQAGDDAKIQLVLSGAEISGGENPAISAQNANKLFVTLAPGTENSLSSDGEAALHSKCDLTCNGSGKLTVTATAGHGITGKDDLAITGGTYAVTSAAQAVDANNSVRICAGSFTLDAGKDGIHAEHNEDSAKGFVYISGGDFHIESAGDGISASATMQIEGGSFDILAGGGYENGEQHSSDGWGNMGGGGMGGMGGRPRSGTADTAATDDGSTSMKGLKSEAGMLISGGSFTLDCADDALHSNDSITINGGTFTVASGDDGVHAENVLTVTACTMEITTCYEGLEAAYIYIQGGEFDMNCDDDGLNAAGGVDDSGSGGRDEMFGNQPGRPGGMGGMGGMGGGDYGLIEISGGSLTIHAGGDGLDSNGDLTISGGDTLVYNPKSGDTSVLDSQNSPIITGGTYIGLGISTVMAETFSSQQSTQGVIACTVGQQAAGQTVTVTNSEGETVLTTQTLYTTVLMIVSSPDMVKGESYTITIGTTSGTLEAS